MAKKKKLRYRQGEIYWFDFGDEEIEGKQMGLHPCLIISNDLFNKHSPVVNILVISSKKKESPVHVKILGCLGNADNYVYCEQWVTASKKALTEHIGRLDDETLQKVLDRLVFHITYKSRYLNIVKDKEESSEQNTAI